MGGGYSSDPISTRYREQNHGIVPHLLAGQFCCPGIILPLSKKEFPQERVQRFLLVSVLLTPAGILLFQGRQEPLEHEKSSFRRVQFFGGGDENGRVLAPIRAELGQACGG